MGSLRAAGTEAVPKGADDLGRFVSNTEFFRPSEFDEKAAMAVLLDGLPPPSGPTVVMAVAGHPRRPWACPPKRSLVEVFAQSPGSGTVHTAVIGGASSVVAAWLAASAPDGEAVRRHISTNSKTVTRPMVLRIVIDTVTSG